MTNATTQDTRTAASAGDRATNTQTAVEFLRLAVSGKAREAMADLAATDFVHHNPWFPADGESLAAAMDANASEFPQKNLEVQRTIAEGSLVMVHSRVVHAPWAAQVATVHIFRFEDGRIRELWDVALEEPADSPNEHGLF